MQRLEVSGGLRHIYMSLGVKRVIILKWEGNQQIGVKEIVQDVVDCIQLPKGTVSGRLL
jgi:hypothetical protein